MTRPSKGAAVFLVFFGLMFFVPGVLALISFLASSRNLAFASAIAGAAIALFICAIGAGFILVAFGGYRRLRQQTAIEESNPASPWLWRTDWAASRAESQHKKSEITAWVICILCNMVMIPFAAMIAPQLITRNDPRAFIFLGFCSIGAILFAIAVRTSLRHRRFGNTYFEFDSLPFSPGGRLTGRIHLKLNTNAEHGVDLGLSCIHKTVVNTSNNRSVMQTVLWQEGQNVPSGSLGMDSFGRTIPVEFAIPSDAYVTDHDNPSDQVLWVLHANADVPGINFTDDFEVPVFRTAASAAQAPAASYSETFGIAETSSSYSDAAPVSAPDRPKVIISPQGEGTEFYFPALRSPARTSMLLIFTAIWSGVIYILAHSNAPWFFPVFFGLMDLLLIVVLFHALFGTARICVGNGEIVSKKRVLGIGGTKRFSISQVDAIVPVTSGQQGGNRGNPEYAIRLLTKDGRRVTLADEITSRQEARWIVSQIESLAGLKIDTRVQVDSRFGPPPPPGQPPGISQPGFIQSGFPQAGRQSRGSMIVSIAIFVFCTAGLFIWQGWRFVHLRAVVNAARAKRSQPAASVRTVTAQPVFAKSMSDADAQRVLALPAQDQAEELLERAIGHDQRALELFEQQVESWVGHIRLTDRMRQLERRSEFSTDLRVRYANADINLTLDGWQKNEQAADMLIERAKTDLHYRPAAVYFLGMLAGRGVAYEKIHPVLLDYAKHDPDATVRLWAVEGMRYLGKDEALDELWESFTQDPSMSVRERAGCNISDCGNFTRLQRMRMVPKLIDLFSDASMSPQMRAFCIMGLREITGEAVPGGAEGWRTWYSQHGAEKLAEFERLEWWQVRGEE
jgi:hypothetical protein